MLPNESLLVVLHFADYKTLVLTKLAGSSFLRIITKFAEQLARRRSYRVNFFTSSVVYEEVTIDTQQTIRYEPGNQASLAAACEVVAGEVGPHAIAELMFCESTWNVPGFGVVFEAAPCLKHADEVIFYGYSLDETMIAANSEALMSNFVGMKSLRLCLDDEAFYQFSWTFLRREAARELRRIEQVGWPSPATEDMSRSVEELVRECAAFPPVQGGEALELDFSAKHFSGPFGLRVIELLKDSRREVTFQMVLRAHEELILDESEYSVDDDGTTKRYASEQSGIFVEVYGGLIAIKSTTEASATEQSRGTNEDVLPVAE